MKVEVTYYGMIAERLGTSSDTLRIEETGQIDLREWFNTEYPVLQNMSYQIAVGNDLCEKLNSTEGEVKVALLPPFSGG